MSGDRAVTDKRVVDGIDVIAPDFDNARKVHDWRNHVGSRTVDLWDTFTVQQKLALALDAKDEADREEWE